MVGVLTGDIINSRESDTPKWLQKLKAVLTTYGNTPTQWELFRGDSFQLVTMPQDALKAALHIKAVMKQNKKLDVRIAIGLGAETHRAQRITESNGPAYVNSGEAFEALGKQTLAINSNDDHNDQKLNLMLSLALLTANTWSSTVAEVITATIEHPKKTQKELATLLGKSQSSISEALKRGGYDEIMNLNNYYQNLIATL